MKIYFLIYNIYGMGGTVRTVLNITNYLADKGYDIEIISVFRRQRKPFFEINPKIKITVLHDVIARKNNKSLWAKIINQLTKIKSFLIHKNEDAYKQFSLLTDLKLLLYIKSLKNGILVSTRPSLNLFVAKHASKNIIKVGQEHVNFESHPDELKESIVKHYPKLDYLITLTEKDNENYKELFKDKNVVIRKITNSIQNTDPIKSELTEKTVIAAGRLDYVKGYDLLIDAWVAVAQKHPDWKLKIFGSGAEKENLLKQIQDRHLYNNVFLMGPTKHLQEELKHASMLVVSSRMEGFGLVIAEAMQCGVPVVSFDCPHGPSEIIKHGEDGILVENGKIEQLGKEINNLIENEQLRKQLGMKAYDNIKRFSVDIIGEEWNQFFSGIMKSQ